MRRAFEILSIALLMALNGVLLGAMLTFLVFIVPDGPDRLGPVRLWYQKAVGLPPAAVNFLHVLSMGPGWVLFLWGYSRLSRALEARGVPVWLRPLPAALGAALAAAFVLGRELPPLVG